MSWSDRRRLLALLAAAPLAACGFTPALAPGAPATALFGRIRADDPPDDAAAAFVARIEERFGRPADPAWRLAYTLSVLESRGALEPGLGETRAQLTGILSWRLLPMGGDAPVARGTQRQFTGFSRTATPLARRTAAEDARARLGRLLADALAAELIATAGDWAA
jgi:LPS-assembly lipoprotein